MNRTTRIAALVLIALAVLAVSAPMLGLDPDTVRLDKILMPPRAGAWMGCDDLGRRIDHRMIHALRTSLLIAGIVTPLSMVIGTIVGLLSGWSGGWIDTTIARVMDVFLAFPGTLLAIALAGLLGPGIDNVIFALTVTSWVGFARLARAQTLELKSREHVLAAHVLGTTTQRILVRHILPLMSAPLIVEATLGAAGVILAEAGLSFLGLGVQPPAASLGAMLRDGTAYMLVAPHMVIGPGLVLTLVVFALNMIGEGLQRRLDPRSVATTYRLRLQA